MTSGAPATADGGPDPDPAMGPPATAKAAPYASAHPGAWTTTWLLLAFMLVNFADKTVTGLVADPVMADLGLTRAQFGTASASFFALFSLSALGVSFLTTRVRTAVLLLGMALLWSAAQLPMLAGAAGFGTLIATRVLLGAAEGPALPVATHHLHGWFGPRERTLPTAILLLGAAAGVAVAAPVLTLVIHTWGWRWAYGVVGIAGLVWAAAWWRRGTAGPLAPPLGGRASRARAVDDRSGRAPGPEGAVVRPPCRRVLLTGTWLTSAAGAFAAYWTLSASLTWMPDYLTQVAGLNPRMSGLLVTAAALANGVVLLAHGLLARRAAGRDAAGLPRRSPLPPGSGSGAAMCVAACAMGVFAETDALWLRVLLILGPMALMNVILTTAQTACSRIAPPERRGVVLGALAFVYALAGILSPLVTGLIVDAGATVADGYRSAFRLTAVLAAAAGLLVLRFLRPERDARRLGIPRINR